MQSMGSQGVGYNIVTNNNNKLKHVYFILMLHAKSLSCIRLFATQWTVACQAPLSMGFCRQEYWSGLPFPLPEDLPDSGIEPFLLCLLHWQVGSLPLAPIDQ